MNHIWRCESPLGGMILTSDGQFLTGLRFDPRKDPASSPPPEHGEKKLPVFEETLRWLALYFSGRDPGFTPALKMQTTEFRKTVWQILLTIPYGQTATYGEIASEVALLKGLPRMSAQAVGGAVGHNDIALIIPCHRVIGADGSLTGYAGGLGRKKELLAMERAGTR